MLIVLNFGFGEDGVCHDYNDVIMGMMASQIISLAVVYSTYYSGADQRKHQSSASLAFVWVIHRWPVNSPHKWPVTQKIISIWWRHHDENGVTMATIARTAILVLDLSLTHWGRYKMAAISQTTLSNVFSWMKMFEFQLQFHWSLFLRFQLTINHHWFR